LDKMEERKKCLKVTAVCGLFNATILRKGENYGCD
jgi:hypothetical protein